MKLIAYNIEYDTDGDDELAAQLPKEIEIPEEIARDAEENDDAIGDYISDETGYCIFGYLTREE